MNTALKPRINKNTVKAIQKRIDIYNQDPSFKEFSIGKSLYVISDTNPEVMPYLKRYIDYGEGYVYDYHACGNIIDRVFIPNFLLIKREMPNA